jgi:putative transposase
VQGDGLIHHSDRGSQYVSITYTERLAEAGIEPSVGSVGDSYDNALAETIKRASRRAGGTERRAAFTKQK